MFETIEQAKAFFDSRKRYGIKPGLERIHHLLKLSGNPEQHVRAIHIAGTNGKGSTLYYLKNALEKNSYRVGVFSSPSFTGLRGHMLINGRAVSESQFISILNDIYPAINKLDETAMYPTEFEILTAMAFIYFLGRTDIVLIEAGMGGREDTTNCFQPLLSIITNIALDHTAFLGKTEAAIAYHKAGIIKQGRPVIAGEMIEAAGQVIRNEAGEKQATVYQLGDNFHYSYISAGSAGQTFHWEYETKSVQATISMYGEHQLKNASIALMALAVLEELGFLIDRQFMLEGMKATVVPGRFEVLRKEPLVVLDAAHNPAGIRAFLDTVAQMGGNRKKHLLFAAFKDKDLEKMLTMLSTQFPAVTLTSFDHPRAASAQTLDDLATFPHKCKIEDWKAALSSLTEADYDCYITGSFHFITKAKQYIKAHHNL